MRAARDMASAYGTLGVRGAHATGVHTPHGMCAVCCAQVVPCARPTRQSGVVSLQQVST